MKIKTTLISLASVVFLIPWASFAAGVPSSPQFVDFLLCFFQDKNSDETGTIFFQRVLSNFSGQIIGYTTDINYQEASEAGVGFMQKQNVTDKLGPSHAPVPGSIAFAAKGSSVPSAAIDVVIRFKDKRGSLVVTPEDPFSATTTEGLHFEADPATVLCQRL